MSSAISLANPSSSRAYYGVEMIPRHFFRPRLLGIRFPKLLPSCRSLGGLLVPAPYYSVETAYLAGSAWVSPSWASPRCVGPASFTGAPLDRPMATQSRSHLFLIRVIPCILTRRTLCCLRVPLVSPPLIGHPSIVVRWIAWFAPLLLPMHGPSVIFRPVAFFPVSLSQRRRLPDDVFFPSTTPRPLLHARGGWLTNTPRRFPAPFWCCFHPVAAHFFENGSAGTAIAYFQLIGKSSTSHQTCCEISADFINKV